MTREASERAVGSEERPQGRSARQQCREESLGLGGAKSPVHPRVQEANKPPCSSSTIRQLFFVCFWGFLFFFLFLQYFQGRKQRVMCLFLKSFSVVVVLEGFVFFFFVMSFFPREKEEKSSFSKVLSLQVMGVPGAAGAPSTRARVQVLASLPTSHPHRKESQQAYPWQRSFG